MTQKEIEIELVKSIIEIRQLNGYSNELINTDIKPFKSLNGFDSLNAIEVIVNISEKIGFDIDLKVFGIPCRKKDFQEITIKDIAENILHGLEIKGANK